MAKNSDILFLAEAPGQHEDEVSHAPLTGPSGKLLRSCLVEASNYSFDNICNCRPPDNRTPAPVEVECCRPRRVKVIEQLKPKLIVGLGAVPLRFMLKTDDLQGLRGRFFVVQIGNHTCHFMPTYHPSFILRTSFNKNEPLTSKFGHCFRMDVERACAAKLTAPDIQTEEEIRSNIKTFNGNDWGGLLNLLERAQTASVKAIDIENYPLRPYALGAKLLTCSVSFDDTNFSFAVDHPNAKWSKGEKEYLLDELHELITDSTIKVAHNAVHECEWFAKYLDYDSINPRAWECTQVQAHFLDERRGAGRSKEEDERRNAYQSLDFLCKMHFGNNFKAMFKLDKKRMDKAELNETLIYNAVDTKFTLRLWHHQTKLLNEAKLYDAYKAAVIRQPVVAMMQHLGMGVDQAEVARCQAKLADQLEEIRSLINNLDVVKQYIADNKEFNPLGDDALVIFRDYLKRSEIQVQDGKRLRWSVDKHVLEKIDHPLAKHIVTLRHLVKMKSTYVDGLELGKGESVWPDGKIHCHFNTTFTETGRLSSDSPNMQQFVKKAEDRWLRKQIIAPPSHYIVAADYGQLEMCCAAMMSKDKNLVSDLCNGIDTHMHWAAKVARVSPEIVGGDFNDPSIAGAFRQVVKGKVVFASLYGSSTKSIAEDLNISLTLANDLMSEFWRTFSGVKVWQDELMKKYYKVGYVSSLTGRRRHYPLTREKAINAPLQCLASELTVEAMCKLSKLALKHNKMYLHPRLNIHDDITLVVPDDKLDETLEVVCRVMLKPSFDFINVPLTAEVSVGRNWCEMEKIDKISSKEVT